jgi:N-acetylneuraminic acid mutarotase
MKVCFAFLFFLLATTTCFVLSFNTDVASSALKENTWEQKTPLTQPLSGPAVAVGDNLYIFYSSDRQTSLYRYNLETQALTQKASVPTHRPSCGIAVVEDKIYTIGGQHTYYRPSGAVNSDMTNLVEVYDTLTDTWETKQSTIDYSIGKVIANTVNDKIYIIYYGNRYNDSSVDPSNIYNTGLNVDLYDHKTDSWTRKSAIPEDISANSLLHSYSCVIDDKIYLLQSKGEAKLHIYDTKTDVWSTGATLDTIYASSVMVATMGEYAPKQIYLLGGCVIEGFGASEAVKSVYRYDPETDLWSSAADMPTARSDAGVGVFSDKIYVIGGSLSQEGWTPPLTDTIEVYTPFGYGSVEHDSTQPVRRETAMLIAGVVVAAAVVAVAGVVVFHFKHVPVKVSKSS